MLWRMCTSPEVGSVPSCLAVNESCERRMPRRDGDLRLLATAMTLLQNYTFTYCYFDAFKFFSTAKGFGLASSSSSCTGSGSLHASAAGAEPGFTASTG